ncbi:MAG: hypothetical protein LBM09_02710, partial [Candidatus Nomurabacteria bacterium]|nr:hypothetical protein [Candidatus Nomurabacteria bacterium]
NTIKGVGAFNTDCNCENASIKNKVTSHTDQTKSEDDESNNEVVTEVELECVCPPTELPPTGPGNVIMMLLLVGASAFGITYLIQNRKNLKDLIIKIVE